jgi:hypothetical protein
MHASIKRMTDEYAFETDLIEAPQDDPFRSKMPFLSAEVTNCDKIGIK